VNPRASRTVPFVAKSIGVPVAKIATKVMTGLKLKDLNLNKKNHKLYSVKEAVFPFNKFPNVDTLLGPEMKSTGEVMGLIKHLVLLLQKVNLQPAIKFQNPALLSCLLKKMIENIFLKLHKN